MKAIAKNIIPGETTSTVAVKMLKGKEKNYYQRYSQERSVVNLNKLITDH